MPAASMFSEVNATAEAALHSLNTEPVSARAVPSYNVPEHSDDSQPQFSERLFVGPMPLAAVEQSIAVNLKDPNVHKGHWWVGGRDGASHEEEDEDDEDDDTNSFPERHAFRYFLQRGGREEDWGSQETLRQRVKREIMHRWRHSDWAPSRPGKKSETRARKWVGKTFRVGDDFLGIPMQPDAEAVHPRPADDLPHPGASASRVLSATTNNISVQAYHTPLEAEGPSRTQTLSLGSANNINIRSLNSYGSDTALIPSPVVPTPRRTSTFPRILSSPVRPVRAQTDPQIPHTTASSTRTPKRGASASGHDVSSSRPPISLPSSLLRLRGASGSKTVQFPAVPESPVEPLPPSEVLERRPSNVPDSSAAAAVQPPDLWGMQADAMKYGDVVRQARMLVRRSFMKSGNVGIYLDAEEAMKLRDFESYEWREFLTVWRKDQLELYEDYSLPVREYLMGHKHLAYVIPLQNPDTRLSLYSFVDFTFCLTCAARYVPKDVFRTASSLGAQISFHQSPGTDVFVFKTKTRTSGIDWMWELWKQLGNDIPRAIDVHCPVLETRVKLPIPEYDIAGGEGYKALTKDHVVDQCRKALKPLQSWDYLIEEPVSRGASIQLCWRRGSMLDWIRWDTDVDGNKRGWAVLYGLCLERPREITHLELRIAEHRRTTVALRNGSNLREPPAVEGYLYRIKPNSQRRTQVYLSTHGGCLFSIHPSRAHPPRPPVPTTTDTQTAEGFDKNTNLCSFKDQEMLRGTQQILEAKAFIDLRSIVAVRRAFQLMAPAQHSDTQESQSAPTGAAGRDEEDEGGDESLAQSPNKTALRMRRSFELLMKTGHVVRFETYSCTMAQEWVEHLSPLIKYWTYRHRADATQEMVLVHAITGNPGLVTTRPERPPDYDKSSEYLPSFWNWCVVDGCLPIMRSGRLFLRRGLRGQYRLMQLVLVAGHLIQFHITSHQASHHLRSRTTSLLGAYVCSGHYAIQALPIHEFSPAQEPLCRRFQDGFENDDQELDTVFLIWYRRHRMEDALVNVSKRALPSLNAKHHVLVLKARSKLERDAWCWALNAEFERLSRRIGDQNTNLPREG